MFNPNLKENLKKIPLFYKLMVPIVLAFGFTVSIWKYWTTPTAFLPTKDFYSEGVQHMHKKSFDLAVNSFQKALLSNEADPSAQFGLGWALQEQGKHKDSVQKYEKSIELARKILFFSYFNKAVIAFSAKNYLAALEAYKESMKFGGDTAEIYQRIGATYKELRDEARAAEAFKKSKELRDKK